MTAFWPCVRQEITLQVRAGLPILACLYCTSLALLARLALDPQELLRSFPTLLLLVSGLPSFFGACFLFSSDLRRAPLLALRATTLSPHCYYRAKLTALLGLALVQNTLLAAASGLRTIEDLLLLALGAVGANLLAAVGGILAARRHKATPTWTFCSLLFLLLVLVVPATEQGMAPPTQLAIYSPFAGPYALVRGGLEGLSTAKLFVQLGWTVVWTAAAFLLGERRIDRELATAPR